MNNDYNITIMEKKKYIAPYLKIVTNKNNIIACSEGYNPNLDFGCPIEEEEYIEGD